MKTCPQCKMRYANEAVFCFVDGSDLIVMRDKRVGTLVAGRYRVEEVIGEGGMATVYRATQMFTERQCAIKIMNATFVKEPTVHERFRREAKNAQRLSHPNIIEIFDQGDTDDGTAYIAMELLRGKGLSEAIAKGALDLPRAISIMAQICRGIARAHDLGVVHRDIKPDNIFLSEPEAEGEGETVKLLDFGIALSKLDSRITGTGEIFGTPQYMAPERITAGDPGPSADIYSLGVLFYEILTGKLPFEAHDVATFFQAHLRQPPIRPTRFNSHIPLPLEGLVLRMLAKNPRERPVDAHRIHADLADLAKAVNVSFPIAPESPVGTVRPLVDARPTIMQPTLDRWRQRLETMVLLVAQAYGDTVPGAAAEHLAQLKALVPEIVANRDAVTKAQHELAIVNEKGRDGRQRFGFAVDALGLDASKAKEEVRVVDAHVNVVRARTEQAANRYLAAQREVLSWEGRCGFQEPSLDLAHAYSAAAATVESWVKVKEEERKAAAMCEANERAATDIEFQIQALRSALATHEREIEAEHRAAEERLLASSVIARRRELEYVAAAMRLCDPLRDRPELLPLFESMEHAAA